MTKFQGKLACLQQVSNPNSQDNFQIYCADMYLVRFLADFAGFLVFWWISRDFADLVEIRGSTTTRNIRSPDIKWKVVLKLGQVEICFGQVHVHKTSPQCIYFLKNLIDDLAATLYYILSRLACIFAHTAFYLCFLISVCSCHPRTTKLHFI